MLRRSFRYLDNKTFLYLYKSLVRSHLDYAASVYHPFTVKQIELLEAVQRRATRNLPGLKHMSYEDRLKTLNLPTLTYRRTRCDMIEMYKVINGLYDKECCNFIPMWKKCAQRCSGRTNPHKIYPQRPKSKLRQNCFSIRASKLWNTLPTLVTDAPTLNTFKNRLDKLWRSHPMLYEYRADPNFAQTGTIEVDEDTESGGEEP